MANINYSDSMSQVWYRPKDWPVIENPASNSIKLVVADTGTATIGFKTVVASSGTSTVDWGDGTVTSGIASDALAEHAYTPGSGRSSTQGYTTFVITITATQNITRWYIQVPSTVKQTPIYMGILDAEFNTPALTSLTEAFYNGNAVCRLLMHFRCISTLNSCSQSANTFYNCTGLKSVDISKLTKVTAANYMFQNCYNLTDIDVSQMGSLNSAVSMFQSANALPDIDLSGMPLLQSASSMFQYCYSLRSVNMTGMTALTNVNSAFASCYALASITGSADIGSAATSTDGGFFVDYCEKLATLDLSGTKLSKFMARGSSGKLNALHSLTLNASSAWGGTSPQIDITYCSFSADELNTLFTSLPTVTGKTIAITGCTGAGTCDTSIATGKGWTVTN